MTQTDIEEIQKQKERNREISERYRSIKIPVALADKIDALIEQGEYQSRAEYVKERIREDLRRRRATG